MNKIKQWGLMAMVGIMVILGGMGSVSAMESTDLNTYLKAENCSLVIGGQTLTPGVKPSPAIKYGDAMTLTLGWSFPNDQSLAVNERFTYPLPKGITINSDAQAGALMNGLDEVGRYEVVNGIVSVWYTDKNFVALTNKVGSLILDGTISKDAIPDKNGGSTEFDFGTVGTFPVDIERDTSADGVFIQKSDATVVPESPGQRQFVLAVTSRWNNTNVVIDDVMGTNLSLAGDVKLYSDAACTQEVPGQRQFVLAVTSRWNNTNVVIDDVMGTNLSLAGDVKLYSDAACTQEVTTGFTKTNNAFPITVNAMTDNQVLYVKYNVEINKEAYKANINETNDTLKNTASVKSDEKTEPQWAEKYINIRKDWLLKRGALSPDGSQITWTIFVNQ